jgi:ADP-ribose pyrophosphatase YjhB (NUDIX family)
MFRKDSFCSYCGRRYPDDAWPRVCPGCSQTTYRNPLPVAVVLVPVGRGVLVVRRGIEPGRGLLALPGGYVDFAETWQQAAARELFEETGVTIDPSRVREFRVRSSPDRPGILVVFGLAPRLPARSLPDFTPTPETTERLVVTGPTELAFLLHTEALTDFFERRRRPRPRAGGKPLKKT